MTRGRTYYDVPFAEKDKAKEYGLKFDTRTAHWYLPSGFAPTSRWRRLRSTPPEKASRVGHDGGVTGKPRYSQCSTCRRTFLRQHGALNLCASCSPSRQEAGTS